MLKPLEVLKLYGSHEGTISSVLKRRVEKIPNKEFLLYQGQSFNYAQTHHFVERTAAYLSSIGVKRTSKVAVMSLNHPSTVFTFFALASLGATMVPINPEFGVEEVRYILNHSDVGGVICSPSVVSTIEGAWTDLPIKPWLMLNDTSEVTSAYLYLSQEVERCKEIAPPSTGQADDICVFIYTSGTTGYPKAVMHSQNNLVLAGEGFVERMYLQPEDRLLCVLPMFHVNAIFYSLSGSLSSGATLILEPKFSASKFWQIAKETGATEVNTIAAASTILMKRPRSEYVSGHQLRKMYGAPYDKETYRVYNDEFEMPYVIEGYGMSEIPGAMNNPFLGPHKIGAMGQPSRHPDPNISLAEAKVVDDEGNRVPTGEIGELVIKTPIVMKGYFKDIERTKESFKDGWFLTGDLVYVDEDNYFWFVARKKDIIRKRGENISGAELDRVINNHPCVLESASIPVPSELGEDDIFVAVVIKDGMTLKHKEVAEWCRQHLAANKVPRYVAFVDQLPHTPTHRIAKFKMKEDKNLRRLAVDLEA